MASNKRYSLGYRRRRKGRTNYGKRLKLLKGRKTRAVIRKSNRNMSVQLVDYEPDGDKVLASATTEQLVSAGWKHATGNIPAAYLVGFAAGSRAKKAGISEVIVDLGMQHPHTKGRLFAAVKGLIDAGLKVPASEDALPNEDRLTGSHIDAKLAKDIESVKKKVGGQ